jgi:hypothetical protein
MGQSNSKILGTWVHYKSTVDNKEVNGDFPPDTIIISTDTFEQRVWVKNEAPFRQAGVITLKKDKIIITKRTTSTSDKYGPPPDIYYRFKLKKETLIIGNAVTDDKIEDHSIKSHYRKLEKK